jgi:hypothetical protein
LAENRLVSLADILSVTAREISKDKPTKLFYVYTTAENINIAKSTKTNLGEAFFDYIRRNYNKSF